MQRRRCQCQPVTVINTAGLVITGCHLCPALVDALCGMPELSHVTMTRDSMHRVEGVDATWCSMVHVASQVQPTPRMRPQTCTHKLMSKKYTICVDMQQSEGQSEADVMWLREWDPGHPGFRATSGTRLTITTQHLLRKSHTTSSEDIGPERESNRLPCICKHYQELYTAFHSAQQ